MKHLSNSDHATLLRALRVILAEFPPTKNLKVLNAIRLLTIFVKKHSK